MYVGVGAVCGVLASYIDTVLNTLPAGMLIAAGAALKSRPALYFSLSMLFGGLLYRQEVTKIESMQSLFLGKKSNLVCLVGEYEAIDQSIFKHRLLMKVYLLDNYQFSKPIQIYVYTKHFPKTYCDDLIIINGLKIKIDQPSFLSKQGIIGSAFVTELEFKKISGTNQISIARHKARIFRTITSKMSPVTKSMFGSIFMGKKQSRKSFAEIRSNFQTWGITHYLARSGLHLTIIGAMWQTACKIFGLPLLPSNLLVMFFLLMFSVLSWTAVPYLRALTVILLYQICRFLNLQTHLIHIISLSCILLIIANPISPLALDFQLSFALTYAIAFLNQLTRTKLEKQIPDK